MASVATQEGEAGGMELLASLRRLGAATETSLDLPVDITYEQFEALGVVLGRAQRTVTWMIADWINHGEAVFGEKVAQAVEVTNLNPDTLDNYARVARKVPRERRIAGVPFGVHAEVAPLEPAEQKEWLGKAAANGWKREELRSHLRPVKGLLDDFHHSHAGVEGWVRAALVNWANRNGTVSVVGSAEGQRLFKGRSLIGTVKVETGQPSSSSGS